MKTHYTIGNGILTLCGQFLETSDGYKSNVDYVTGKNNIGKVTCKKCKQIILANAKEVELKDNQLIIKE